MIITCASKEDWLLPLTSTWTFFFTFQECNVGAGNLKEFSIILCRLLLLLGVSKCISNMHLEVLRNRIFKHFVSFLNNNCCHQLFFLPWFSHRSPRKKINIFNFCVWRQWRQKGLKDRLGYLEIPLISWLFGIKIYVKVVECRVNRFESSQPSKF